MLAAFILMRKSVYTNIKDTGPSYSISSSYVTDFGVTLI